MILINKSKEKRTRNLRSFTKKKDDGIYNAIFFLNPEDIKDTAFLTINYDENRTIKIPKKRTILNTFEEGIQETVWKLLRQCDPYV